MRMAVRTYAIGAGATVVVGSGSYFRILSSAAPVDLVVRGRGGNELGTALQVSDGFAYDAAPESFEEVRVTSAAAQNVLIAVADGPISYDRISGSITATVSVGATLVFSTVTAVAVSGAVVAANANRRKVRVKNMSATETVYLQNDGAAATVNDYPLLPGAVEDFATTDGINCIRGGAVDAQLKVVEERD